MHKPNEKYKLTRAVFFVTTLIGLLLVSCFNHQTLNIQNVDSVQTPDLATSTVSLPLSSVLQPNTLPNKDLEKIADVVDFQRVKLLCANAQGNVIQDHLYSESFELDIPFQVYFPPCKFPDLDNNLAYATLYLLHGLGSDESQWLNLGLETEMDRLIKDQNSPFIVIMPKIPDVSTWPSDKNATFFSKELIPYIDARYPTLADDAHRAIGGLSRGAAWALRIGLTRADSFGKIGLHSLPLYDDEVSHWVRVLSEMSASEIPQLFMDSGKNEMDLGSELLFDQRLTSQQIPHEFHVFDGNHDDSYWSAHLPLYLEWYARGW